MIVASFAMWSATQRAHGAWTAWTRWMTIFFSFVQEVRGGEGERCEAHNRFNPLPFVYGQWGKTTAFRISGRGRGNKILGDNNLLCSISLDPVEWSVMEP